MKIKKVFSILFMVFLPIITLFGKVVNVKGETLSFELDFPYGESVDYLSSWDLETRIKKTVDGEFVYCGERDVGLPGTGLPQLWGRESSTSAASNSKQMAFIYENGYHGQIEGEYSANRYLTGNPNKDYYITQIALWYYGPSERFSCEDCQKFNYNDGTYNGVRTDISEKIVNLVNDARNASKNPSVSFTRDNDKMSLSGGYYISAPITLVGNDLSGNISISVSGANGVFVTTDPNATSGALSFPVGSKIYVKVPSGNVSSSTKISLSASGSGTIGHVYWYNYNNNPDSSLQKILRYEPELKDVNNTLTLTMNQLPVVISKKDVTGEKEVEGAHLVVKNSSGAIVTEWISTKEAKTIYLSTGDYTLTETIAPKGYIKSSKSISFTVNNNGKVTVDGKDVSSVIMTNEPIKIRISKVDIINKEELPGAILRIVDEDGNIVKDMEDNDLEWISTEEAHEVWLPAGKYTLIEDTAPKGYKLSSEKIEFEITEDGKIYIADKEVAMVTMTNDPIKVYIAKTDLEGKYLAGAKLRIIDESGNTLKDMDNKDLEWISTMEPKELWLSAGKYTLIEVEAPEGYELSDKKMVFEIDDKGNIKLDNKNITGITISMENTPEPVQVPTGNTVWYIALGLGIMALIGVVYFILSKNKN